MTLCFKTVFSQEYTFQFFLDLNWCDERLIADFSSLPTYIDEFDEGYRTEDLYNLMEGSTYHIDRIWRPNIFVPNNEAPGSIDSDIVSSNSMRVDLRTGRVWIRKRSVLYVNYSVNVCEITQGEIGGRRAKNRLTIRTVMKY